MIELVPMAYRIVNEVDGDAAQIQAQVQKDEGSVSVKSRGDKGQGGIGGEMTNGAGTKKMDEDEERDAVFFRLEMLGYRVGQGLVERYVRLSLEGMVPGLAAEAGLGGD